MRLTNHYIIDAMSVQQFEEIIKNYQRMYFTKEISGEFGDAIKAEITLLRKEVAEKKLSIQKRP